MDSKRLWHRLVTLPLIATNLSAAPGPRQLLAEADRLAWVKAWIRAEPIYAEAEREFAQRGDRRNELYAQISKLRGQLTKLPAPQVSQQLDEYLADPTVQADDRLKLRCLVIKGEIDEDIDPDSAEQAWRAARDIAQRIGDAGWANRAQGELGLIAGLQGDLNSAVIQMMTAIKAAEASGDVPSQVRWLTVFAKGYIQLGKYEQSLPILDRALKAASQVPELQPAVMTLTTKGIALAKVGRYDQAEQILNEALAAAAERGSLGYQAELLLARGSMAAEQKKFDQANQLLNRAMNFAVEVGGNRLVAEISIELGGVQLAQGQVAQAMEGLLKGIAAARAANERFLLPRLLAHAARIDMQQARYAAARERLTEAADLLEGLFSHVSSPWVRGQLIAVMDDVYSTRIELEGRDKADAQRLYAVVEQVRGRSLFELLLSRPASNIRKPAELVAGEREISQLQARLFTAKNRVERQRILDAVLTAEANLAPISTDFLTRSRINRDTHDADLRSLKSHLGGSELFLEFALAEPNSYCIVVSRRTARIQKLPGRKAIEQAVNALRKQISTGGEAADESRALFQMLLSGIAEISTNQRLLVVPDGTLHALPFDLLISTDGARLLNTHVISYVPSGAVLEIIRQRQAAAVGEAIMAVASSPANPALTLLSQSRPGFGAASRNGLDFDLNSLRNLPSSDDEARAVAAGLGVAAQTVLVGKLATESELKRQALSEFRVLHFATHGVISTKYPERSALVLQPDDREDGLFQAREVLDQRLQTDLVTLSACETGKGADYGQDGVASLVRPFLAAGARTVVANLWIADDAFSLGLMKEFYRRLGAGEDKGLALRNAKLEMLKRFGPQAKPDLWAGVVMNGDSVGTVVGVRRGQGTNERVD